MRNNIIKKSILFFGYGYTAMHLKRRMDKGHWKFYASTRKKTSQNLDSKIEFLNFEKDKAILEKLILSCDAILISAPPVGNGDPVLEAFGTVFKKPIKAKWIGYLSATSIYGDFKGNWVTEATRPKPLTSRGINRFMVEEMWRNLGKSRNLPVFRFRISGIYGPGRSPFLRIIRNEQRVIQKPNQVFNRIHIDDLCEMLYQTISSPVRGRLFNISDNKPSSSEDFLDKAADLLSHPKLKRLPFEAADLSDIASSFYAESKKVSNKKIVKELGYKFKFPTFVEGLENILKSEKLN